MATERLAPDSVRESLRPRLRLFMSADIVGSTAFKQRSSRDSDSWFGVVRSFYSKSQGFFEKKWDEAYKAHQASPSMLPLSADPPELWKTIGDEVLFTKEIEHPHEALICMSAWMGVLTELRSMLTKSKSLDLKASAWLADFPIRNREIFLLAHGHRVVTGAPGQLAEARKAELAKQGAQAVAPFDPEPQPDDAHPQLTSADDRTADPAETDSDWENAELFKLFREGHSTVSRDFIGQSIDTGFRVSAEATSRKLTLSVELAHMLSKVCVDLIAEPSHIPTLDYRNFNFYFDGRQPFKGVLGGIPYPVIWLDTEPRRAIYRAEDALMCRPKAEPVLVHGFTTALIREFPTRFCTMLEFPGNKPTKYDQFELTIHQTIRRMESEFLERDKFMAALAESNDTMDSGTRTKNTNVDLLLDETLAGSPPPPPPLPPAPPSTPV